MYHKPLNSSSNSSSSSGSTLKRFYYCLKNLYILTKKGRGFHTEGLNY